MSLVGMGYNASRFARNHLADVEGCTDFVHIVAVDFYDSPAESFQLGGQGSNVVGVCQTRALLQAVVVDDESQIVQAELGCSHDGFPVATFLHFSIARDDHCAPGVSTQFGCFCHANCDWQAMAQWACVGLNAGHLVAIGVAVEA